MNKHTQIEAQLSRYRLLDTVERQAVDQHLATCPTCSAKHVAYQQQEQMVSELVEQRQQMIFRDHQARTSLVYQQLLEQQAQRPASFTTWRFGVWPRLQRQQPLFASGLLIALILIVTLTVTLDPTGLLPVTAQPTPVPTLMPTPVLTPVSTPLDAAHHGIGDALAREVEFWGIEQETDFAQFIDPAADETWRGMKTWSLQDSLYWEWDAQQRPTARVLDVELLADDVALAHIEMTFPTDSALPWHAKRVYRYATDEGRWYWSQPPTELWGEEQTLETKHLLFKYRDRDAAMIEQVAPRIEDAYLKLHDTLQVTPGATRAPQDNSYNDKATLEIVPEDAIRDSGAGRVYRVGSPSLFTGPFSGPQTTLSITDTAAAGIFHALVTDVVNQARGGSAQRAATTVDQGRFFFESALHDWLLDDSLSIPFTQQLYHRDDLTSFLANHRHLLLFNPDNASSTIHPEATPSISEVQAAYAVLIDYMVSAYGRDVIPLLVREMTDESDTWDELIPDVFNVSRAEFEAGWNAWLLAEYPEVQEIVAVRAAIEESLALEAQARSNHDKSLLPQFIDPWANDGWLSVYIMTNFPRKDQVSRADQIGNTYTFILEDLQVTNDIARAHVRISSNSYNNSDDEKDDEITTVEDRFYHQVGDRWLLTSPVEELLGETHVIETEHFRITYYELDADAVKAAAPELETAYRRLLETLELPTVRPADRYEPYREEKFEFEIVPDVVDGGNLEQPTITISSPVFKRMSAEVEPSAQLSYMMFGALLLPLIDERIASDTDHIWGIIMWGIRQWISEDAGWRKPDDRTLGDAQITEALTDHYPVRLAQLKTLENLGVSTVIGITLMEFTVDTYGREMVVPLLEGMGKYTSWEELIPAVFAVTAAQFEADWNEWLAERYRLEQAELGQTTYCTDPNGPFTLRPPTADQDGNFGPPCRIIDILVE